MKKDWDNSRHHESPRKNFLWNRSTSEPDLTGEKFTPLDRLSKYPFEYINVDDLKFFRRKKPSDFHTRSNICLYDDNEPVLPFATFKTEYRRRFKNPLLFLRSTLTRKDTTLKLEGHMEIESEQKAKYLPYREEEVRRSRRLPVKNPENLTLAGDLEFRPEYTSAYVMHPLTERNIKLSSNESTQMESILDQEGNIAEKYMEKLLGEPATKIDPPKCNLKLEGEMSYLPEYRSQFVQFPIEKSHSIPQLSHIKFQGSFVGVPEYTESFKCYDHYSKSAPIKKADHINFHNNVDVVPEYTAQFKEPDKSAEKSISLKTDDHLEPKGEFSKNLPEYHESFQDPKITQKPERGKCREPYLRLKGKIEFNPEYRSTYLDYPRSRPITKKSTSSFRLSNSSAKVFESPKKKFLPNATTKYHDANLEDLPFTCQPEYRKAKRDILIKERPLARKITEGDSTPRTMTRTFAGPGSVDNESKKGSGRGRKKRSPRKRGTSPQFKLTVENVDDLGGTFQKASPKFGRRASLSRNAHNNRERTNVIEGNSKYIKTTGNITGTQKDHQPGDQSSFVVLDEPCKHSAWMKKSWYET